MKMIIEYVAHPDIDTNKGIKAQKAPMCTLQQQVYLSLCRVSIHGSSGVGSKEDHTRSELTLQGVEVARSLRRTEMTMIKQK